MTGEIAIDTYEDLGYWNQTTGRFIPYIRRLRVPAAYGAVLDAVYDMLTEIGGVFQIPESPVPISDGKHLTTLEMGAHAGMYIRDGDEHKQRGLIVQLRDTGDGKCTVSVACRWPLNYADETRQFLACLKRYWPGIRPLDDPVAPGEAQPQTQTWEEALRLLGAEVKQREAILQSERADQAWRAWKYIMGTNENEDNPASGYKPSQTNVEPAWPTPDTVKEPGRKFWAERDKGIYDCARYKGETYSYIHGRLWDTAKKYLEKEKGGVRLTPNEMMLVKRFQISIGAIKKIVEKMEVMYGPIPGKARKVRSTSQTTKS